MLKIREEEGALFVVIPFAAKDDLRQNFPKAKWHPARKMWSVAISSRERMEQWIEAVKASDIEASQADVGAQMMTQKDIERTKAAIEEATIRLDSIKTERLSIADLRDTLAVSRKNLSRMRDHIEAQKAEMEMERAEQAARKDEFEDTLAGLIDLPTLSAAYATIKRFDNAIGQTDIAEWVAAQDILIDARNACRNANLCLEALEYLSEIKQGRDLARQIVPGAWYSIAKLRA
jgi:hypothetical protein